MEGVIKMANYKCRNCGYTGHELVFQFNDYTYCVATNEVEPEYKSEIPDWVKIKHFGDAKIGEPVGCSQCHAWGVSNFERI